MKILSYIPLLLGLLLGGYSTNVIKDFKFNKAERHHKRILKEKSDSIRTFFVADSIKYEQICQMQGTMSQLKKENTYLVKQNAELTAWKQDAQDGIITDTIEYKTNIFGKRKRIK